jgi:hypothetical protein
MLVIYEAVGAAGEFLSYLIRSLLSEGRIRYETVEKTKEGFVARLIEREGPTGLIMTTTWTSLHPENETRMFSLTVRDDRDQTKNIMHALASRASGQGSAQPDLTPWHALQEWLQLKAPQEVIIPYAPRLAELANPSGVRLRRDFEAVLNLIKTHALLHQTHRERDTEGRIVASVEDYRAVHGLVADLVSQGVQTSVNQSVRETVEVVRRLWESSQKAPVSTNQLAQHLHLERTAAWRRAKEALQEGYLTNQESQKGLPLKLVPGEALPMEMSVLPHPDALALREGGVDIPPDFTATVQPSDTEADDDLWEGVM